MAATWSTLAEWRTSRRISTTQFREMEVAGIAPEITNAAGMKIVTLEASEAWEKTYGLRVLDALFRATGADEPEEGA